MISPVAGLQSSMIAPVLLPTNSPLINNLKSLMVCPFRR
jgi:hypothetical protein